MIKNAKKVCTDTDSATYNTETEPRGSARLTVRSHVLTEVLRNAQRWMLGYESPETKTKDWGSVFDCLLLTPGDYESRIAVKPETYTNKKGEASKWRKDLRNPEIAAWYEANERKLHISETIKAACTTAVARLRADALIADLIDTSEHQVMLMAEWHDPGTGLVVPMKALIDIAPPVDHPILGGQLFDLKTTKNASPRSFGADAQKFRYDMQGALYMDLWNAATGEQRIGFGHVLIENYPPFEFRTPPPLLSERFLQFGRLSYQAALAIYCRALKTGVWPSYDQKGKWPITDCADWFLDMAALYPPIEEEETEEDETATETEEQPTDIVP